MIIMTHGLTKTIGQAAIIDNLDLAVPERSIYGFLGPNGAGKTTTIRMLLGLSHPTRGDLRVFGKSFASHRDEILSQIGSLVEGPSLYDHLTGYENLEVAAALRQVPGERIHEVLGIVGLTEASRKRISQYSYGMKQRLGLGIAILHKPQLLILDEPTNGLDPAGIRDLRMLILSLCNDHGMSILLSSHFLSEIEQIATHVGVINNGQLLFQGTKNELLAAHQTTVFSVDNVVQTKRICKAAGYKVVSVHDNTLTVAITDIEQVATLNEKMVREGIRVYSSYPQERSLENIFMQLTGKENKT